MSMAKAAAPTQKADIYSFAIILHEMLTRRGPFGILDVENTLTGKGVARVCRVCAHL